MRKVRLLRQPGRPGRPLHPSELGERSDGERVRGAMLYFRHRCDEAWYENLIEACGLDGKRITSKRARKLLLQALDLLEKENAG